MCAATAKPTRVRLNREANTLELEFAGQGYALPAEYLRVYSPSAEVRGHGPGEGKLVSGKLHVRIDTLETAGRYALKIVFDDGHDTGLYSWEYLRELGEQQAQKWQAYLDRLEKAGQGRDPDESPVRIIS